MLRVYAQMKTTSCSILLMVAACSGSGAPMLEADFVAEGESTPVGGGQAPATGKVIALWSGDQAGSDYLYKYGDGTYTTATFEIGVDEPMPAQATFNNEFGIGTIALVDAALVVPEGIIDEDVLEAQQRGLVGQYAIVYRGAGSPPYTWLNAFPTGLSCGKCVQATTGMDTFEPADCGALELQVGPESAFNVCNWH